MRDASRGAPDDDGIDTTPLLADLYALTMLQAYFDQGMRQTAVFELFVRALPPTRNFLVAAGLEQALRFLERLRFDEATLDWLARSGRFRAGFLDSLRDLRFTGTVDAMHEGTVFFPDEPVLRVIAPIREAQLVEARLLNLVHFETVVASKAARVVLAARGRRVVDFGLRRAHGPQAGVLAARACWIAGFDGSSDMEAGRRYGIPLFGTMAHSFVQAHDGEAQAFEHFARSFPDANTLLIDTWDTEAAARTVAAMAPRLAQEGIALQAVRLDSGDLGEHARKVRRILDDAGLGAMTIFASGNLDEWRVDALRREAAPIDAFGVGTRVVTASDAPYLDCAYKLQEYDGRPTRKRSEGKATWPGRRQAWRTAHADGTFAGDLVTLASEPGPPGARPLLHRVMDDGRRVGPADASGLPAARERCAAQLRRLPQPLRELEPAPAYPVAIGEGLLALRDRVDREIAAAAGR